MYTVRKLVGYTNVNDERNYLYERRRKMNDLRTRRKFWVEFWERNT